MKKLYQVIIFAFALCLIASFCSFAEDTASELGFIFSHNPTKSRQMVNKQNADANILIRMIKFYQLFISTQDMPVCNFTPSCSQFGIASLREFGVIRGILLTSDRLQRCNGFSAPYYQIDYKTGKYIDPVETYSYLLSKH